MRDLLRVAILVRMPWSWSLLAQLTASAVRRVWRSFQDRRSFTLVESSCVKLMDSAWPIYDRQAHGLLRFMDCNIIAEV